MFCWSPVLQKYTHKNTPFKNEKKNLDLWLLAIFGSLKKYYICL